MTSKRELKIELQKLRDEVRSIRELTGSRHLSMLDGKPYQIGGIFIRQDSLNESLANLIDLLPECWEVTQYKSSERPPEQLFRVLNRLTGKEAFGATEEEAKLAARWRKS